MSETGTAVATAPAGTGGINGDLPLSLGMYKDMNAEPVNAPDATETPATEPQAADEQKTPQPDTASQQTEKPSDDLVARARLLNMSDEEIGSYASPRELDRFVSVTERNVARLINKTQQQTNQQQPKPEERKQEPAPESEEDWSKPILEKFQGHGYDKELIDDVTELTSSFRSQLSKRDSTITELRDSLKQVQQHLMAQEHRKEISEVGEFINSLGDDWAETFGKGDIFEVIQKGGKVKENLDKLWDASDEIMALARMRGDNISRKEAIRRAHLIDWHDKAREITEKKAKPAATEEKPRDQKTGQFISPPRKSNGAVPSTDPDAALLTDVGQLLRSRGLKR